MTPTPDELPAHTTNHVDTNEWLNELGIEPVEENPINEQLDPYHYIEESKNLSIKLVHFTVASALGYMFIGVLAFVKVPLVVMVVAILALFFYTFMSLKRVAETSKYSIQRTLFYTMATANFIVLFYPTIWVLAVMLTQLLNTLQPVAETFSFINS